MAKSLSRPFALAFLLALALPSTVLAQDQPLGKAKLSGVVLDASGKPAEGYPMAVITEQWGKVIMQATGDGGTFGLEGLPAGNYEVLVFAQGTTDNPVASKKVTLTDGHVAQVEIRLGSPTRAAPVPAGSASLATGFDWTAFGVGAALLVGVLAMIWAAARSRRRRA